MSNPTQFKQGDIVAHYKSFYNTDEDYADNKYFYKILYPEAYTTDDEPIKCVVYQALYGDKKVWIRHYDEFMSDIDVPGNPFKYRFISIYEFNREMSESDIKRKWTSSMIDNLLDKNLKVTLGVTDKLENRNNRVYSPEAIQKAAEEYMKKKE